MTHSLTFDAISEATPGPKWTARWNRSWPAYEAWFVGRGGDNVLCAEYLADLTSGHCRVEASQHVLSMA